MVYTEFDSGEFSGSLAPAVVNYQCGDHSQLCLTWLLRVFVLTLRHQL